ncbi:GEVED domain-containing protein [Flavobacterium sp.]|jgi:hypothetical protein|uniref:GEVED domain-containing protein n=1 Tax=Flavobacterium sp. TaxID=239 RepID=UPI0037BF3A53
MKKITFWLFALFTCWHITAQTTVTIGAGTTASGAFDNGNPIYRSSASSSFNFSQSIQLLTAADLAAAGVTSGSTITKIAFYKNNSNNLSTGRTATMNIFLKNSVATALSTSSNFNTWTTGSTNCYSNAAIGAADFPAAAGWVEFTFSTPFNYNGGSIETAINWSINSGSGSPTTGPFVWLYTTSTAIQAVGTSDSASITGNLASSQTRIYNTQLTYTNTPCSGTPAPGNVIFPSTICNGSSATLSLQNATSGSGVTYQWYMNSVAISGANSATYVIPSVTSTANYYCEVTCSTNMAASSTVAVGPTAFTAPLSEPFTTFLPNCWTNMSGGDLTTGPTLTTGSLWVADGLANNGTSGAIRNNIDYLGSNDWVISPAISIPATGYELKFDAAAVQYAATTAPTTPWEADDFIEVLVSSTGTTAWTPLFTYNDSNQPGIVATPNIIDLDAYAGQNVRFAFRAVEGATDGFADIDFSIDNFQIRLTPSCVEPLGLVSASVTWNGASVSWDATSPVPSVGYEYFVSTTNSTPTAAGTATTNPYAVLTGLLSNTPYYIFVRSVCGSSDFSPWSASISFTTACAPITTFPSIEPFDTFLPNVCWSKGKGGDLTAGPTTFGSNDFYEDGFANVGFTGSFAYNIYYSSWSPSNANDWIISPLFTIPATGYELKFDAAAANYDVTTAVTDWESDDSVEVLVSSTGTTAWTPLFTYNDTNVPSNTGSVNIIDLDAYSGQTVRFAYRVVEGTTNGTSDFEFFIDNFQIRLTPSCIEPLGLVSSSVTSTGASISWDATSPLPSVGYEYFVSTTNTTPTAAGTATTNTYAVLTGLLPNTPYYIFVRAACGSSDLSPWSTSISFTTSCTSVTSFVQNFDAVTTPDFPNCWGQVGTTGYAYTETSNPSSSPNTLYMVSYSTTSMAVVKMQPVSNLGDGTHRLKLKIRASSSWSIGGIVEFGYLTNPMDATTFVAFTTMTAATLTYENMTFAPPVGTYSDYPAFRHTGAPSSGLLIDDVVWEAIPTCPDQTGLIVTGVTFTAANTFWDNLSSNGATGYEYAITTSATPPTSGTATTATFYVATGLTPQTLHYLHVRAACAAGAFGTWSTLSFFTGYCMPSSTANTTYVDNFSTTGGTQNISNLATGFTTGGYLNASTQFVEGFATSSFNFNAAIVGGTAGFAIWIDWNNDMLLDDATEKVYNTTSYSNGPFSGTISIPAGTALGNYKMRITTDWNASNPDDPCAAVSRGEFEDYTITVIAPPACAPPAPVASGVADMVANINWPAVPSAALGYEYVLNTVPTDPTGSGTAITGITYAASALTPLTTYYFHVRSVCSIGTYSTWNTVTFTTVATPPVNDDCATATVLTPGGTFATNPLVGTNIGSTASAGAPAPGCASYLGGDVWYSVIVPASGNITFDSASVSGSPISDSGMAVYSGPCSTLVLVECDDDDSLDSFSKISLTNRTPGEVLYVRFWEYENNAFGTFQVSAYDASLSAVSFDTSNFVAYPNPVKDVLNLSYKTAISNVKVINLLGQEVVNAKANTNDVQVDMSALNAGVYIVNVTVDDTVHSIKVIKE